MMPNAVINRSSRASIEKHVTSLLLKWANAWFQSDFSLEISFNDDLWAKSEKKDDDRLVTGPSSILLSNAGKLLDDLSLLAMNYDRQAHADDKEFWRKLEQKIWHDLLTSLVPDHAQEFTEEERGLINPAVSVLLSLGSIDLNLSIDKKTFELLGLIGKSTPLKAKRLSSLNEAIKQQAIQLSASLKPLNIMLKDILELKKGDVIKLDHGLQSPIIVEGKDGRVPLGAFLVKQKNTKALLITGKEN